MYKQPQYNIKHNKRVRDMFQWLKYLLCEHKGLVSGSPMPTMPDVAFHVCYLSAWAGARHRQILKSSSIL